MTKFLLPLTLTILIVSSTLHADSIGSVFALQQPAGVQPQFDNPTNVLLGNGTPLLSPTLLDPGAFGQKPAYLAFASFLAHVDGRLDAVLTLDGVTYKTGGLLFCASGPSHEHNCVSIDSFLLPRGFYDATPATLTISFNGQTKSFVFNFIEPAPEPATLLLFATGVCGVGLLKKFSASS